MDEQRRSRPDDKQPADPAEGVRIIGPDEAAEAIERGDVAPRRSDDELRYGDRPPAPPAGPRPALRFPLDASADPTRIERPPVEPAPDPVTGPVELPHWTEPPTGEVPAVLIGDDQPLLSEDEDDLDAWSSFATSAPRWRDADDDWGDDGFVEHLAGDSGEVRVGALGDDDELSHDEYYGFEDMEQRVEERTGDATSVSAEVPVASGTVWDEDDDDWSASAEGATPEDEWTEDEWDDDAHEGAHDEGAGEDPAVGDRGPRGPRGGSHGAPVPAETGTMGRDMGQAVGVGIGLAVVGIVCLALGGKFAAVLVAAILGLCAAEYFNVLRRVGWEAATLLGLGATVAMPLAVYWRGIGAYGLVGFVVVVATLSWYVVGAGGPDPRVLEGSGATLLGIAWIGGLGSAATAMVRMHDGRALLLIAIFATVAYDVGGFLIGRAFGHRPLTAASPNKTLEGLVGGMVSAFVVVLIIVGILKLGPYAGAGAVFVLGLGAAFAAPLGDLCQSQLKRDLGVKDMGTILPGHGGMLDRFDGMLFVLPAILWLSLTLGHVVG
jgi:phosphatidate cytidylyltransferase